MANILTGVRILCGILILCFPAFSGQYYFFYLLGGFTDAVDGTVARKTGEASDFGEKFDTAADFVFAAAVAIKILGNFSVPRWLIVWIAVIALIKIGSHIAGFVRYHELRTVHSVLNKVSGAAAFLVPLLLGADFAWQTKVSILIAVCVLASVAAAVEAVIILKNPLS